MTLHPVADRIISSVEQVLLGKTEQLTLCLSALIADGHVLIEDVPGVGKTVLARALAISVGADFKRIQFTPDLLPGDVIGTQIYNTDTRQFEFRPGPIVTQILLADEINRATPKTQSALLESMDERRFTVDGVSYTLPRPFLVMATQNPVEFEGTFPLPESQLDRFLVSLQLGYPGRTEELRMLTTQEQGHPLDALPAVASVDELLALQADRREVYVDDTIRHYILDLVESTRRHPDVRLGASPRATLALFQTSQAWALVHGRQFVLPDDVKAVASGVLRHRVVPAGHVDSISGMDRFLVMLADRVPVPGNRG